VLYVQGDLPDVLSGAVAIVGSRKADAYGLEAAALFAGGLAAAGVPVVSGFARGIDAAAHRAALAAGGETVAVLGCGLGVDYPRGHRPLGLEIAAGGCLVTEFPCGLAPRTWHFPVRNRLIAALAEGGILVVQAALRSGSLSTARHGLELGRDIFALPGRIFDERSLGTHALIRDGAQLVQHPRDVLDSLRLPLLPREPEPAADADLPEEPGPPSPERALLRLLARGAFLPPEDLADSLELPVDRVLGLLLELELEGRVRRHPGSVYGRG
jgi:DNA processing protein